MAVRTIANGGGNYSAAGTWVEAAVPTAIDDVVATGTSGALTIDVASVARSVDLTGYVSTITHASAVTWSIGDTAGTANGTKAVKFPSSGWTYTLGNANSSAIALVSTVASTTLTCDFGGKTLGNLTVNSGASTTHQLVTNAFLMGNAATLAITQGTFDTNSKNITIGKFTMTGSLVRQLTLRASVVTIASVAAGNFWNVAGSNNQVVAAPGSGITTTGTIVLGNASANSRTFVGGANPYGILTYTVAGSTGPLVITGANSFVDINFTDATNARTLTITAGTTQSIKRNFNVNGTAGKLMTINSSTPGTAAGVDGGTDPDTLLPIPGGYQSCDFLNIQDSSAGTVNIRFYAGANSTSVSGNSGWIFTPPPPIALTLMNQSWMRAQQAVQRASTW